MKSQAKKEQHLKNIYGKDINVLGVKRLVGEVFIVKEGCQEIDNLIKCKYLEEVKG